MDPITLAALIAGGSALTKAVGGGITAAKSFSAKDRARLRFLEEQKRRGGAAYGLSSSEVAGIQEQGAAQVRGIQRQAQSDALQVAASTGGKSGREIFLSQLAGQQGATEAQAATAGQVKQAQDAKRADLNAEIATLQQMEKGRKQGIISAVTGGLVDGGNAAASLAAQEAAMRNQVAVERAKLGLSAEDRMTQPTQPVYSRLTRRR